MRYLENVVTLSYDRSKCVGCTLCQQVCPHRVFQMVEKRAVVVDKDRCIECGACMMNCPAEAITVRPGVGCAQAIIYSWFKKHKWLAKILGRGSGGCC